MIHLRMRSESERKRLYRRDNLARLAERVWEGEGLEGDAELSVLFCDDAYIRELNRDYRKKDTATDVLSFPQDEASLPGLRVLGDIVISLETVERYHPGNAAAMRDEVRLLFCHGLLHLLGYEHGTRKQEQAMRARQAQYLGIELEAAWHSFPDERTVSGKRDARGGGA